MIRRELVIPSDPRIWLASWPRSGNTLLRQILYYCFGIKSDTAYENDITGEFSSNTSKLVKTHNKPPNDWPAIYVVRDGREACVSYMHYMRQTDRDKNGPPLRWVIEGHHSVWFGTWSQHIALWSPRTRTDTLLLSYENMVASPGQAVEQIAEFLNANPTGNSLPTFASLHKALPTFFRSGTNQTWKTEMIGDDLDLFWGLHGETMEEFGYGR